MTIFDTKGKVRGNIQSTEMEDGVFNGNIMGLLIVPQNQFIETRLEVTNADNGVAFVHTQIADHEFLNNRRTILNGNEISKMFFDSATHVVISGYALINENGNNVVNFLVARKKDGGCIVLEIINNTTVSVFDVEKPDGYRYLGNYVEKE